MDNKEEMVNIVIPMDLYLTVCKECGFLKDDCCNGQCFIDAIS